MIKNVWKQLFTGEELKIIKSNKFNIMSDMSNNGLQYVSIPAVKNEFYIGMEKKQDEYEPEILFNLKTGEVVFNLFEDVNKWTYEEIKCINFIQERIKEKGNAINSAIIEDLEKERKQWNK